MPTVPSSTDRRPAPVRDTLADTAALVAFRARTLRRPRAVVAGTGVALGLTLAAAVVPAFAPGAAERGALARAEDALVVLPTLLAGFLVLAIVSAIASGGGRELLGRDPAAVLPVSPAVDHLGALLMAPLNVAWMVQAWSLLGATAYAVGPRGLLAAQVLALLWLVAATCLAQVVAWSAETLRRGEHGVALMRLVTIGLCAVAAGLQLTGRLGPTLDRLPTAEIVVAMEQGLSVRWLVVTLVLLALALGAVVLGAWPAHLAARRVPRDEVSAEVETHAARALPGSDHRMLLRIDRASVWRAVPMRRGLAVLAAGPGLVALAGGLGWETVVILPGLVLSGGALLFGINAWCLDGRGALWRESLPVAPQVVFDVRARVLAEWLLIGAVVTVALASLRAGVPTAAEAAAVLAALAVITLQVVAVAMSWSGRRPFAVQLRSARATPAPPVVMVGYSAKLAVSTTLTALVFSVTARLSWELSVAVAVPFLAFSALRLLRARRRWTDAPARALVVTTVAA